MDPLLLQTIENIVQCRVDKLESVLCKKIDDMDEHKNAYTNFVQERQISKEKDEESMRLRQRIDDLEQELKVSKEIQHQTELNRTKPVLKGDEFQKQKQILLEELCKYEGNHAKDTHTIPHSGDAILTFQDFFKVVIDFKNYQTTKIDNKELTKIMFDAQTQEAHAAILVYPALEHNGFIDIVKDEDTKGLNMEFDRSMVVACTPERIYEAIITLMARYIDNARKIKTISEPNTSICQNLSLLNHNLLKLIKPLCETFATNDKNGDGVYNWAKDCGKLMLKINTECGDMHHSDANLIAVKKVVHDALAFFPIKAYGHNLFSISTKRKLECEEDNASHKRTKMEITGETQS